MAMGSNYVLAVILVFALSLDGVALGYWRPQGRFGKRMGVKDAVHTLAAGDAGHEDRPLSFVDTPLFQMPGDDGMCVHVSRPGLYRCFRLTNNDATTNIKRK